MKILRVAAVNGVVTEVGVVVLNHLEASHVGVVITLRSGLAGVHARTEPSQPFGL